MQVKRSKRTESESDFILDYVKIEYSRQVTLDLIAESLLVSDDGGVCEQ